MMRLVAPAVVMSVAAGSSGRSGPRVTLDLGAGHWVVAKAAGGEYPKPPPIAACRLVYSRFFVAAPHRTYHLIFWGFIIPRSCYNRAASRVARRRTSPRDV